MKNGVILATCLIFLACCGKKEEEKTLPTPDGGPDRSLTNQGDPDDSTGPGTSSGGSGISEDDGIPVETIFINQEAFNDRIKGDKVTFQFASNFEEATFECKTKRVTEFTPCGENNGRVVMGGLLHSKSYSLEVRARLPSGDVDETPVVISFLIDNVYGGPAYLPASEVSGRRPYIPSSAMELPYPGYSPPPGQVGVRQLLLGDDDLVIVPFHMMVDSYSTNFSIAGGINRFRALFGGDCLESWERLVKHPSGASYCEGYPSLEVLQEMPQALPLNHVVMEGQHRGFARERLTAAAFLDGDEWRLPMVGYEEVCRDAEREGTQNGFRLPIPSTGTSVSPEFRWCLRKINNQYWWTAHVDGYLPRPTNHERLVATYAVQAGYSRIIGPEAFVQKAARMLRGTLIPLGKKMAAPEDTEQ